MNTKDKKNKSSNGLSLGNIYLFIYNVVLTAGWAMILVIAAQVALKWKSPQKDVFVARSIYPNVEFYLLIFQTAAILEVVHAAVGLVRSNPMLVFFQVLSRLIVVWAICYPFKNPRYSLGFSFICFAWPIAEIVRYSFYAFNLINFVPYFVTWCRYSFFIILYPIGVTGELLCMFKAYKHLEPLNVRKQYSYFLPNMLNISFDACYCIVIIMLLYIPIFPKLYCHMWAQRKKALADDAKSAKKTD